MTSYTHVDFLKDVRNLTVNTAVRKGVISHPIGAKLLAVSLEYQCQATDGLTLFEETIAWMNGRPRPHTWGATEVYFDDSIHIYIYARDELPDRMTVATSLIHELGHAALYLIGPLENHNHDAVWEQMTTKLGAVPNAHAPSAMFTDFALEEAIRRLPPLTDTAAQACEIGKHA